VSSYTAGQHALVALGALGAGFVNAVSGGGTLLSFPVLVAVGVGKVQANITNTVALCPGYVGGAVAQRTDLEGDRARVRRLAVVAAAGGLAGSILLLSTSEAVFAKVVPWLIFLACALLGLQGRIKKVLRVGQRADARPSRVGTPLALFAVSVYGGYFGAGVSIMLLAVLGIAFSDPLPKLNALKQVLAFVINIVAAAFFVTTGEVQWTLALVMAPASLFGGFLGGRVAGRLNPDVLRAVIITFGTILGLWYLLR